MGMVKAMRETSICPDFIVIDGAEGGTGASPLEFSDHIGMPMRESLLFVHNTLVGAGLRSKITLGAAGKIVSAFDIAAALALGEDWVTAGRGIMFSPGRDRKSVVLGKSVSARVDLGGRRSIKKK